MGRVVLGDRAEKLYYRRTHHAGDARAGDARGCRRLSQNELERTDCPKVTRGRPQEEEGDHSREIVKGMRDDSQGLRDKSWLGAPQ